jgi:hypothetical protein
LDVREAFIDGSFASANQGVPRLENIRRSRAGNIAGRQDPKPSAIRSGAHPGGTLLYQHTVQRAFPDVFDALVGYRKSQVFRIQQKQSDPFREEGTKLSNIRYKGGAASYLVLGSDTRYFAARLDLARADVNEFLAFVGLGKCSGRRMGMIRCPVLTAIKVPPSRSVYS